MILRMLAGGNIEFELPNGPKLTGLAPDARKFSTRDAAGCGDKSGAAQSWATGGTLPVVDVVEFQDDLIVVVLTDQFLC